MQIRSLKLNNFRNYESLRVNFNSKMNLIYGLNGEGKTNLIEAIYVLALTKSFRTSNDKFLIKQDFDSLSIEGEIKDLTTNKYQIMINKDGKTAKINKNKISKLSDYISKISVILFNPDDLRIIKDSPSIRRKNLNMELSQLNNTYLKYLNKYNKILKQRNAYLKTLYLNSTASYDYLQILTNELIELGLKIYEARKKYFENINELISDIYFQITGKNGLKIKYLSDFSVKKENIVKKYKQIENKDMLFGKTNFGIHLDDYVFYLNEDNLKDFGSEGQQKNAIIAYKLSELELFNIQKGTYPILILDDLFSELDQNKIKNILAMLNLKIQTFITTTEITKVSKVIKNNSKKFKIKNGMLEVVENGK